ncbi:Sin-like protein conserved region-domain-containing protein [Xylariaceae sp. FL0016]|nr:Sin-like protein conserved region-domain-containing protein [Xylariaceae sp. FL0016]
MDIDTPPQLAAAPEATDTADRPDNDDADPIVASYSVYANPSLPKNRKLLILQHPNKQGQNNASYNIAEVRAKPKNGMYEVDVPLSHANTSYDKDKGQRWGGALAKSMAGKSGGSHGLAGGFGVGVSNASGGGKRNALDRELDMMDWTEAVRQDKVLRTQTLGGQIPPASEELCRWMVGVFKGDQLHLTSATAVIPLRPQLHHLDAASEQDRLTRGQASAGGGSGAGDGTSNTAGAAARAITMSIKSAGTGEGQAATETMADRLHNVQREPWRTLPYSGDSSEKAWDLFHDNLLYRGAPSQEKQGDSKGKGKEKAISAIPHIDESQRLRTQWGTEEFLKAVSGMKDGPDGGDKEVEEVSAEVKKEEAAASAGATKRVPVAKPKAKTATPTTAKRTTNAKGKNVAFQ